MAAARRRTTTSESEPTGRVFGASGRGEVSPPAEPPRRPVAPTRPPPPLPPRPAGPTGFKAGQKVRHPTFGEGVVVMVKPTGGDEEVTVAFPGQGVKRLLASMAHLDRV